MHHTIHRLLHFKLNESWKTRNFSKRSFSPQWNFTYKWSGAAHILFIASWYYILLNYKALVILSPHLPTWYQLALQTFIFSVYIRSLRLQMNMQHMCACYFLRAASRDVIVPAGGQRAAAPARIMVSHSSKYTIDPGNGAAVLSAPLTTTFYYRLHKYIQHWGLKWPFFSDQRGREQNIILLTQIKPLLTIWQSSWSLSSSEVELMFLILYLKKLVTANSPYMECMRRGR